MRGRLRLVHLLLGVLALARSTYAATFTVDSTGDQAAVAPTNDGVCDAQPGAAVVCTLRAAIQEANAFAGADTINFAIGIGLVTIQPGTALPTISSVVTIDGTTQPGYAGTPIVELDGVLAAGTVHGLNLGIGSSTSVIRGLVIQRFSGTGIRVFSSNTVIAGNYIGTDATGTLAGRGNNVGFYVQGGSGNRIGGTLGGDPNLISGNTVDGIQINGAGTTLVQGNIIGLNWNGTAILGNGSQGIAIFNAAVGNIIGGTAAGSRNVISGNGGIGVTMSVLGTTGNRVEANFIGTNAAGTAGIGNFRGIDIGADASGNFIGGAGAGNRIAYNANSGVTLVFNAGTGNLISENEIFLNGTGLGIDLSDNGVTVNDPGDGDAGPNNLQNFPVLSAAMTNGAGSGNFAGSLNSAAGTLYRIEFFASAAADGSGFGEGERFLGATNVTTNAAGHAVIGVTLATALAAGEIVTATATDPANNTSEFSAVVTAVGSLVVTTTANTVDGTTTSVSNLIAAPGADGRISLHEAILATNATAGTDTIRFGIPLSDANHLYYQNDSLPGSLSVVAATALPEANITDFDPDYAAGLTRSWYRIAPIVALPTISGSVVLDGATQPGALVGGPVIEIEGSGAGAGVDGLRLTAGSSTVRALVINGFQRDGVRISGPGGDAITGNYIGTNAAATTAIANGADGITIQSSNNTVGGTTAAARNVVSGNTDDGIEITGGALTGNVVQGNYVGLNVLGTAAIGNGNDGIVIWLSRNNTIGGTAAGAGNVVGGNQSGLYFGDITATGNSIVGNYIGTNASGTAAVGNITGIYLDSASTTVGGTAAGARNVISGNSWAGLWIAGANGVTVQGNYVGTAADGTTAVPNNIGVYLNSGASNNSIGGGASNRIARNLDDGVVLVAAAGAGNQILSNEIYSNGGLGIDLNDDGASANDALDVDSGPNSLLNFPFVTAVLESGGTLTAYYKLDVPAGSYRIEFFENPSGADPSGNGEGETFAGSVNVTHPGGGSQNFNASFSGAVGDVITATATFCTDGPPCTSFGSTSEFSGAITAVTTAVELISFDAVPRDGAIDLVWSTGSELDNLGFHLYRALSASGLYERITEAVIPGLGSSPMGASYQHSDSGLTNGVAYFYKLEDIETAGRTTFHGPVSAVPEDASDDETRKAYGDPSDVSLRVLERTARGVLLELVTGGFFGTPEPDGATRLEVPGFDVLGVGLELPVKRTWLEAVAGRRVSIASVRAFEETSLPGLRPPSSSPEVVASPEGTVRAGSRRTNGASSAEVVPASAVRVVETGFQGEVKKALIELAPLRWDGVSQRLLWARRLQVRLIFDGVDRRERSLGGSRGLRHRERRSHEANSVVARLTTSVPGLYRVPLGDVLAGSRTRASSSLRLSRRGEAVPFHRESRSLYFVGEKDAVYELALAPGGQAMDVIDAVASGPSVTSYERRLEIEENRYYQAGLLDAPSLWLWDVVVSPSVKSYPFRLGSLLAKEVRLEVFLQGASDFAGAPDHLVRISVNGVAVGEAVWDGKAAHRFEASLLAGMLREGENEISIENRALYSMVFLDRFSLLYERPAVADSGVLEGRFLESGVLAVEPGSFVVRTSPGMAWLRGVTTGFVGVEAGSRYLVVSPDAVLEPAIRKSPATGLLSSRNQADYLLIGPREFLPAAVPLVERRRSQGLRARAVAVEDVYDDFGFGERGPGALKAFLEFAYHHWASPAPRYVVLFGDATYDPKDYLGTGVRDRVPALMLKTSYLWTASDPLYAAVNGEDRLPDLAIGRLPAATLEEAWLLVEKALAYEESAQDLSGPAVFVADNADAAGDFETDSDEVAATLVGGEIEKIYLRELGAVETRRAIVDSLDRGASLWSYAGHGGIALWASENIFQGSDVESLSPQGRQPILMTMNCLNGYFHFPYFDSLGEAFLKAENRGAIAAFSPSGLSLNGPAHFFHQALVEELASGRHARLGDAVLAAQRTYAESGLFPELLAIYHLLGDPALRIR